eukprot:9723527-Prorocentrum_lima.AAC.1
MIKRLGSLFRGMRRIVNPLLLVAAKGGRAGARKVCKMLHKETQSENTICVKRGRWGKLAMEKEALLT